MQETKSIVEELQAAYPDKLFRNTLSLEFLLKLFSSFEKQYNMPVGSCGGHACAFETSVMLYLAPELVNMEEAKAGFVGTPDNEFLDNMFKYGIVGVSEIGVIGDPTVANAELGEKFYNAALDEMEKCLNFS